ncbi:hypothetical protein BDZ45DRAFT_167600 [Acephala macrosclerotiorum]|nr:hypothetical protein BDZ45DRAFT_167600 [Acephala macrosclerotiorum]
MTQYCFRKSYSLLDSPDFAASFQRAIRDFPQIGTWHRHFGLILDIFSTMPRWLVAVIDPAEVSVLDFSNDIVSGTNSIVTAYNKPGSKDDNPNVIHRMLESPDLPANDKAAWHLALEARTLVGAGTETTGSTLSVTTYHLLANPEKAENLKKELEATHKQAKRSLRYQKLQQLPYLISQKLRG